MSQTRIKRSYDSLQSSSPSSPLESAYKRSRLPLARQMSEDDGESMMLQLSPTAASPSSSSSSSQPQHLSASASALSHDAITSDALRLSSASASSASSSSPSSASAQPLASASSSSYRPPSPFVSRSAFDVSAFVDSFPVKRRRPQSSMDDGQQPVTNKQHIATAAASASPALPSSSPSSVSPSPVFSLEQVKRIVSKALQLQEERLRDEYGSVLNELLREQFENFERFNKDYISRQISKTELSYLS